MKVELRPGLQGRAEAIVDTTNVAAVMGSGDLDVFATPVSYTHLTLPTIA